MQLNYDCIRDVLLFLEKHLAVDENLCFSRMSLDDIMESTLISDRYSVNEVAYTIHNLYQCEFIDAIVDDSDDELNYIVFDITYIGHEFLSSIRNDNIWNKIKEQLLSIKITSIPAIVKCADSILTALIK